MLRSIKIVRDKYRIQQQLRRASNRNALSVSLNSYYLDEFPDMTEFGGFKEINIWSDTLESLPSLGSRLKLVSLNILSHGLAEMSTLRAYDKLQVLNIWDDNIRKLPRLDALNQLQELWVVGSSLTELPALNKLTNLRLLNIETVKLTRIPKLDKLVLLKSLTIGSHLIDQVPALATLCELESLSIWGNRITSLPDMRPLSQLGKLELECRHLTHIASLPLHDGLHITLGETPLVDPPRLAVESGMHSVRKYYWDKNRNGIWFAGRWNLFLNKPSALAWAQTLFASLLMLGVLLQGGQWVNSWLAFAILAPLFLMRTRYTNQLALSWFNKIIGKKYLHQTRLISVPFKGFAIGLMSIPLRFSAVLSGSWRYPFRAFRALPSNWRHLMSATDVTSTPEIIPGSELVYCGKPKSTLTISRLWKVLTFQAVFPGKFDHDEHDEYEHKHKDYEYQHDEHQSSTDITSRQIIIWAQAIIGLLPIYFFSKLFNFFLQSTTLIFWPLLFWNSAITSRVRLMNTARDHKKQFIHQILRGIAGIILLSYLVVFAIEQINSGFLKSPVEYWQGLSVLLQPTTLSFNFYHAAIIGVSLIQWGWLVVARQWLDKPDSKNEKLRWLLFRFVAISQNICVLILLFFGYEWLIQSLLNI